MNIAARRVTGSQQLTVSSITQRMYDEAGGDLNRAEDMIVNFVSQYPDLTKKFIRIGARQKLAKIGCDARPAINAAISGHGTKAQYTMSPAVKAAQMRAIKQGLFVTETLFDLPYKLNGIDTKLGDLTGHQVIEIGSTQLAKGATMVREGRWLIAAGNRAGERKMRVALTAAELQKIKAEAEGLPVQ